MATFYLLCFLLLHCAFVVSCFKETVLFNFNTDGDLSTWTEESDTVREVGMSKADMIMQKTQRYQRAILFTLLNPQHNGAGFAGVRTNVSLNLTEYESIALRVRGQGSNKGYKVVLRHKGQIDGKFPSYCQYFVVPTDQFDVVNLPLEDFKAHYRGKLLNDTKPLDVARITTFGIQMYGGVYLTQKQSGASSLEIDRITAIGY